MKSLRSLVLVFTCFVVAVSNSFAGLEITDVTPSGAVTLPSGQEQCIEIKYRFASTEIPFVENAQMTIVIPAAFAGNTVGDFSVSGSIHAPGATFDPGTRELTWDFIPQLPAGSSGTLSFCVTFPAGTTVDGLTASIDPQFTADGETPGSFGTSPVFTAQADPQLITTKTLVAGGAIDGEAIYELTVSNPAIGSIDVTGVTLTDTFADGAVYKESIPSGLHTDNASPAQDTVSWALGDVSAGSSKSVFIRLEYPDGPFTENQQVTNEGSAEGTLVTNSQLYQTPLSSSQHGLGPANPDFDRGKGLFSDTPALGWTPTRYSVSLDNIGTAALTNVVVEDTLPKEFFPSSIDLGIDTAFGSTLSNVVVEIQTTVNGVYTAVAGSPFTLTDTPASVDFSGVAGTVTHIRVTYPTIGVGYSSSNALVVHGVFGVDNGAGWYEDRDGVDIPSVSDKGLTDHVVDDADVDTLGVSNILDVSYTHDGNTTVMQQLSADYTIRENRPRPVLSKSFSEVIDGFTGVEGGNGNIEPLDVLEYTISLANAAGATEVLSDPEFVDLLPDTLILDPASIEVVNLGGLTGPNGTVHVTDDHDGSGQTLLRFAFTGDLAVGGAVVVKFRASIKAGVSEDTVGPNVADLTDFSNGPMHIESCTFTGSPPSYDTDDNGSLDTAAICGSSPQDATYTVQQLAALQSEKQVLGEYDATFSKFPDIGTTPPGGTFDYKLALFNPGNVPATDITLIDIFPFIGDTGVIDIETGRQSEWAPFLDGAIAESGVLTITRYNPITEAYSSETGSIDVEYSTATNPCRPELFGGDPTEPAGCTAANWAQTLGDYSTAASVRITFKGADNNTLVVNPLESIEFGWTMRAPETAMPDEVAWNSFGFVSSNANDSSEIPPTEPIKVGVRVDAVSVGNLVWIDSTAGAPATEDNGIKDGIENPLANAQVEIWQWVDSGSGEALVRAQSALAITGLTGAEVTPAGMPLLTDAAGLYEFTGLMPTGTIYDGVTYGDFVVRVSPPVGLENQYVAGSAAAGGYEADPNLDGDNNNNGIDTGSGNVLESGRLALTLDGEPAGDGQVSGDDLDGNLTIDFAFVANDTGDLLANLGNVVWLDSNGDGVKDTGEPLIEGATVTLYDSAGQQVNDAHGNPVDPVTTGTDGLYSFIDLLPGDYIVKVTPPAPPAGTDPYEPTPATGTLDDENHGVLHSGGANGGIADGEIVSPAISLAGGDTDNTIDFGLIRPLSLGDLVWIDGTSGDVNAGNGTQDGVGSPGEAPLPGATVELFNADGSAAHDIDGNAVLAQVTDTTGSYLFTNLLPGDYIVKVTPPANYEITINGGDPDNNDNTDSNAGVLGADLGDLVTGDIVSDPVTLGMGVEPVNDGDSNPDSNLSVDFGFVPVPGEVVSLGNLIWFDQNGNGVVDGGEPVIEGATVELFDENGDPVLDAYLDPVGAVVTGTDGLYSFGDLLPGDYIVKVTPPAGEGYFVSPVTSGDTANGAPDDDNNGVILGAALGSIPAGSTVSPVVTLAAGENDPKIDFGFTQTVSVGNYVWVDYSDTVLTQGDGIQDGNENAFPGAVVWLLMDDPNNPGTLIQASDADGNPVASVTTGSDGLYQFGNLLPGDYVVGVEEPQYYDPSPFANANDDPNDETGTYLTDNNGFSSLDIDIDGNVGDETLIVSEPVTLLAGTEPPLDDGTGAAFGTPDVNGNGAVDFGFVPEPGVLGVSVGDFVWLDENRDGTFDGTEEAGIAGATVTLLDSAGNPVLDANLNPVLPQVTDGSGAYSFDNLIPGDYIIRVTPPADHAMGRVGGLDPDLDTTTDDNNGAQVNGQPYGETPVFTLVGGEVDPDVDFGLVELVSLGNYVWFDTDANGLQDPSENGVENATVALLMEDPNAAGTYIAATDAYGNAITAQTTGSDGLYSFGDLYPGNYKVRVTPPAGMILTPNGGADPDDVPSDLDNNGVVVAGQSYVESLPVSLEANDEPVGDGGTPDDNNGNYTVDFGFIEPVSIGDFVWFDLNADGQQAGESGLEGATVVLLMEDPNAAGTFIPAVDADGNAVAAQVTGTDGAYNFGNLLPGEFVVRVTPPPVGDYLLTPNGGADPDSDLSNTDNNAKVVGGQAYVETDPITLSVRGEAGDGDADHNNNPSVDIGFIQTVSIGDYVWLDANGDGQQAGESGLANATVELLMEDPNNAGSFIPATDYLGNAVALQTTDGTGAYNFVDLLQGDYVVRVTPPAEHLLTPHDGGDPDADASNTDNNGNIVAGQSYVESDPVTLTIGLESASDGQGVGIDANGDMTVDFGFVQTVAIGSVVFDDTLNKDGDQTGDPALVGATVELLIDDPNNPGTLIQATDVNGSPVAPQVTIAGGAYHFDDLYPGDYVVRVTPPAGYAATPVNENDPNGNASDVDSNGQPVSGESYAQSVPVTLTNGGEPAGEGTASNGRDADGDGTIDFGFVQTVSVGDYVWLDADADGDQTGENGLAGTTVSLWIDDPGNPGTLIGATDASGAAVAAQVTDGTGFYEFLNLFEGEYVVRVDPPAGHFLTPNGGLDPDADPSNLDNNGVAVVGQTYVQSEPVLLEVGNEPTGDGTSGNPVDANGNLTVDFGFYAPVSLGDYVWFDRDGDGDQAGESGLEGATVTLIDNATGLRAKDKDGVDVPDVVTGTDGAYNFGNLVPGGYTVRVVPPADYLLTGGSGSDPQTDNNGQLVGGQPYAESGVVTLSSGGETGDGDANDNNDPTIDFGFVKTVSVGNYVWLDVNGDGQQAGENGLQNATVELLMEDPGAPGTFIPATDYTGTAVPSQTTGPDGLYDFSGLLEGDYVVRVTPPADHLLTPHDGGDPDADASNTDNNGNVVAGQSYFESDPITLVLGDEPTADGQTGGVDADGNMAVDFGFVQTVAIGSVVFDDTLNHDGDLTGDPALVGATVELLMDDPNNPGTLIQAVDADGVPVAPQVTIAGGAYNFDNLYPGDYVVRVTPPAGYAATPVNENDPNGNASDTDSNGQPVSGEAYSQSVPVTLTVGGEPSGDGVSSVGQDSNGDGTIDFGFVQTVSLGDYVWLDANVDGDQGGESGLAGATVSLWIDDPLNPGTLIPANDASGAPVASVLTLADGAYAFANLLQGDYVVRVDPPAGHFLTTGTGSDVQTDNNGLPVGGQTYVQSAPVTLTVGAETGDGDADNNNDPTIDFGFYAPVSLGDYVWFDRDGDGDQAGESGLQGATVTLIDNATGLRAKDKDGVDVPDVVTGTDGAYNFGNLVPGGYTVRVVPPADYLLTGGSGSDPQTDNNGQLVGGQPYAESGVVTLSSGGETGDGDANDNNDPTIDFGFVKTVSVGNYVWLDVNGDGQQAGESGLANATVELLMEDPGAPGTFIPATDYTGTAVPSQTTGADGLYDFSGLLEGDYVVRVTPPADHLLTPHDGGDPDADASNTDNNGNVVAGQSYFESDPITLVLGDEPTADGQSGGVDADGNMTVDFGFVQTVAIGSVVFFDRDQDGDQTGESGLPNVLVELLIDDPNNPGTLIPATDVNGNTVSSQTTPASGSYHFDDLYPGNYVVRVTPPTGFAGTPVSVADPNANASDLDSNGLPVTGERYSQSAPVVLTVGGEPSGEGTDSNGLDANGNGTIDFGIVPTVSIGNHVWLDTNANGLQAGESGLAGATVSLWRDDPGNPGTLIPAIDASGAPVDPQVTDGSGFYEFLELPEGEYVVRVQPPVGVIPSPIAVADPNLNPSNADNNGLVVPGETYVQSIPVLLVVDQEPVGDGVFGNPADANGNMTIDFGFVTPLAIGDFVWFDVNGDGLQAGESGLAGATVELLMEDPNNAGSFIPATDYLGNPVASQVTDSSGAYNFGDLAAGNYVVRVTPPAGHDLTNEGADANANDANNDNNGRTVGGQSYVESTPVALSYNGEPVTDGDTDTYTNLSVDFGFVDPTPDTWLEFVGSDPGASGTPGGNDDGDVYSDLLEYALGLSAASGVPSNLGFCAELADAISGQFDAYFIRPEGAADLTYTLEARDSFVGAGGDALEWFDVTLAMITPTVTSNGDGTETVRYENLESIPGLSTTYGLVRLRIDFDDGNTQASDTTQTFGWQCTDHNQSQCASFSAPFTNKPVFSGTADGNTAASATVDATTSAGGVDLATLNLGPIDLDPGAPEQLVPTHYLQITSGAREGERWDIGSASGGVMTLVNDADIFTGSNALTNPGGTSVDSWNTSNGVPADDVLLGASFQVLPHKTIDQLFDKTGAFAGLDSTSDETRVLLYNNRNELGGFETLSLALTGMGVKWIYAGDPGAIDQGARPLDRCAGSYIHSTVGASTVCAVGLVADYDLACPFDEDYNLVGAPYPMSQTPNGLEGRAMEIGSAAGQFNGSGTPSQSSEILLWMGDMAVDDTPAPLYMEGYETFMAADDGGSLQQWVDANDPALADLGTDAGGPLLLRSWRAVTVKMLPGNALLPHIYLLPGSP